MPSSAYAIYRLPYADYCVRIEGETQELYSCTQLNGMSGFVVAPFEVKSGQPIVIIRPDKVMQQAVPCHFQSKQGVSSVQPSARTVGGVGDYAIDFANFHAQLQQGTFRKIVLARCVEETTPVPIEPEELFFRACQLYPRLFIALVSTAQSGTWLTATPEILLEGSGHDWRTIALAGTMKLEGEQLDGEGETVTWNTKNIQEQRYVATYIVECLEQFSAVSSDTPFLTTLREEGPRTIRAANLVHLRSDFTFSLSDDAPIGSLLQALHPTPAVCGLPKREAFKFIVSNECAPRRYYSGFMGLLQFPQYSGNVMGEASTHLYVSLRCMNICGNHYYLYAGGGLLPGSTELQEWQETEAKLETMRTLLI